jgi:putative Holliday junction resolvase
VLFYKLRTAEEHMQNKKEGLYLSFDFGLKRIGVAVGQTVTGSARGLTTLKANEGIPDWPEVQTLIDTWRPAGLVVGLPLNMDGTTQAITESTKNFIKALQEKSSLPVFEMDERLSTIAARDEIFSKKGYKGLKKAEVDAVAAKLILESWFALKSH